MKAWEFLQRHLGAFPEALDFIFKLFTVLHTWDDLVDQDKPLTNADIHRVFFAALVEIPRNHFYQRNFNRLNPLLEQAIYNWHIATTAEREGGNLEMAYSLRSSYTDLASACLVICLGANLEVLSEFRKEVHPESFKDYLNNLEIERKARDVL